MCCPPQVRTNKPYMKYSNVRMSDGASFTGNMVATATAHTLKVNLPALPLLNSC